VARKTRVADQAGESQADSLPGHLSAATCYAGIDIVAFLPADAIDPIYFDKAYYLGPDKRGAKPYQLLAQGAEDSIISALTYSRISSCDVPITTWNLHRA